MSAEVARQQKPVEEMTVEEIKAEIEEILSRGVSYDSPTLQLGVEVR